VLTGILFVLKTGIAWEDLPAELGLGCGHTCRTYLHYWQQQGVWKQLPPILLKELQEAHVIDWERAGIDSSRVPFWAGNRPVRIPRTEGKSAPTNLI
jgi:transposase